MGSIIMCGEMAKATMREVNPKGLTRRVIKPQPTLRYDGYLNWSKYKNSYFSEKELVEFAPHKVGDILWVRETVSFKRERHESPPYSGLDKWFVQYYADGAIIEQASVFSPCPLNSYDPPRGFVWGKKCPAIHMPRSAARLFLRVTGVRAEQLQDISEDDAIAEGVLYEHHEDGRLDWSVSIDGFWEHYETHKQAFERLWDNLNAKRDGGSYAWGKNPWVWVYKFERVSG